jgi:D-3-phosphoglycerate dehydrogenase
MAATVLITDYAWPDTAIEQSVLASAGHRLVCGPAVPAHAAAIEALVRTHQPAAILTNWAPVSAAAVAAGAGLKLVARLGVGLDNIAVATCTERGAWVSNVPDYCVEEVSDHALAFVLAWTRGLISLDRDVHAGRWEPATAALRRLSSLTCGIVGFGHIGARTAQKLAPFGCRLLVHARRARPAQSGVQFVSLDALLGGSDVVILHVPLTADTSHLLDARRLALMKPGSLLVNVSRGAVIDTAAMLTALQSGRLDAVGLDVVEGEPQVPQALREHPRAMLTPHVAFSSDASIAELRRRAAEEVVRVLSGQPPRHACNQPWT